MKHVVLDIFTITKLAKCKQFQLVTNKNFLSIKSTLQDNL